MPDPQVTKLLSFPQRPDVVWQGGFIRIPHWTTGGGTPPYKPVCPLWVHSTGQTEHLYPEPSRPEDPQYSHALDALVQFVSDEDKGGYRPGRVQVSDPALGSYLATLLSEAGVVVECQPELPAWDALTRKLAEGWQDEYEQTPGYLTSKGVAIDRVRAFAEAAQLFHQANLWRYLRREDLIRIERPSHGESFRCVAMLDPKSQESDLTFYHSEDDFWGWHHKALEWGDMDDADEAWHLAFQDINGIAPVDADLWVEHGLPVAGPEAYPDVALSIEPNPPRRPGAATLSFLEGLLRALALVTEAELDRGWWNCRVATFDGEIEYSLSLPFLLSPPDPSLLRDIHLLDPIAREKTTAQVHRFAEEQDIDDSDDLRSAIMEEFKNGAGSRKTYPPRTDIEAAQDICYQARESIGWRRTVLARQAIDVSPDCADSYLILAEMAPSREAAEALYLTAVEAGRRGLGDAFFREHAGQFWSRLESRPFLRALHALAETRAEDRPDEAIRHFQELLQLDPDDHQGVRFSLLPLLIRHGDLDGAERLHTDYSDERAAAWAYLRALIAFCRQGDSPAARSLAHQAIGTDPSIVECLLPEEEGDDLDDPGAQMRALQTILDAADCLLAWETVPGASEWLVAMRQAGKAAKQRKHLNRRKRR